MQLSIKPNRFSALYGAAPRPRPRLRPRPRGSPPALRYPAAPFQSCPGTTVSGQVLRVRFAGVLTANREPGGLSACDGRFARRRFTISLEVFQVTSAFFGIHPGCPRSVNGQTVRTALAVESAWLAPLIRIRSFRAICSLVLQLVDTDTVPEFTVQKSL
jgi:hypothetical protein